ncbi:hypothetical protein AYK25_05540 [Thermoplasmatales archaeon SM1-50]|nr:MAG: hypothetical protein AYK25_05540 [Thermoplasmatales archaeon SM1-50]
MYLSKLWTSGTTSITRSMLYKKMPKMRITNDKIIKKFIVCSEVKKRNEQTSRSDEDIQDRADQDVHYVFWI